MPPLAAKKVNVYHNIQVRPLPQSTIDDYIDRNFDGTYNCAKRELISKNPKVMGWYKLYGKNIEDEGFTLNNFKIHYILFKTVEDARGLTIDDVRLFYRVKKNMWFKSNTRFSKHPSCYRCKNAKECSINRAQSEYTFDPDNCDDFSIENKYFINFLYDSVVNTKVMKDVITLEHVSKLFDELREDLT